MGQCDECPKPMRCTETGVWRCRVKKLMAAIKTEPHGLVLYVGVPLGIPVLFWAAVLLISR